MVKTLATIAAEMVDREAIRDCLYRYCRGIDRVDADLLLSAYWPDGVDEHGNFAAKSAQEFVDVTMPILNSLILTKHALSNILIDIQGDTAFVESYVTVVHRMRKPDGAMHEDLSSGRYLDRMERRKDEWRIKHRIVLRDWFREFPDAMDWDAGGMHHDLGDAENTKRSIGHRKPHDRSYEVLKLI